MRPSRWTLWLAAGCLAFAPRVGTAATDEEVQEQLRAMQQQLQRMDDDLRETRTQLEQAQFQIDASTPPVGAATSKLASFIESIEFGGWVSASYFYNFRSPDGRDLGGFNAGGNAPGAGLGFYPFKPDSNSFQLDQVWLEIERPVSAEHRGGFRLDFVYGKTAELLNANEAINPDGFGGSDEDFELYQAYVQYLAPIGNGVTFQFGKFATLIGAEVAQAPYNFNITRGNVYNLFQPITHTGILASTEFDYGLSASFGLVNETRSFPAADIDLNNNKALLWSLGWSGETVSASFAGAYGDSDSGQGVDTRTGDKETILDFILSWDPNDRFSSYINADWIHSENSNPAPGGPGTLTGEFDGYGIAVAGRYAVTERLGLAMRGEWVDLSFNRAAGSDPDAQIWGLTGTMDFALTNHLMVRGELRYDVSRQGQDGLDDLFLTSFNSVLGVPGSGQHPNGNDQFVGGVEVIYTF